MAEEDPIVERFVADQTKREVRDWLRGCGLNEQRTLGILGSTEQSLAFAERIYAAGAEKVWAVEIDAGVWDGVEGEERRENSGKLLIELPSDPGARKKVFAWEKRQANSIGYDGTPDRGQRYLFTMLD